jgi:hypothetical protein
MEIRKRTPSSTIERSRYLDFWSFLETVRRKPRGIAAAQLDCGEALRVCGPGSDDLEFRGFVGLGGGFCPGQMDGEDFVGGSRD